MTSSPPNLLSPLALPFDMDATLSSSSPEQQEQEQTLPNELLRHIFLYLDPHTLYTSVRGLNAHWQRAVEHDLLHDLFRTRTWRVGLRVSRKPRLPSEAHEGSLSPPHQQQQHDPPASASIEIGEEEAAESAEQLKCRMARQEAEMREVLGTPHITEDDVLSLANTHAALNRRMAAASSRRSRADAFSASRMRMRKPNRPIVHVVPLVFDAYRPGSTSLAFSTGDEWHALFDGLDIEHGSRLELDFGLCWRFPGDGQDPDCERKRDCHMAGGSVLIDEEEGDDEQELLEKYWGTPDVENGWLSRFYCSSYDLKRPCSAPEEEEGDAEEQGRPRILRTTPLARRVRRVALHPSIPGINGDGDDESADAGANGDASRLTWSDEAHEYAQLRVELGIEFFTRRSARTNLLSRRLESFLRTHAERASSTASSQPSSAAVTGCNTPALAQSPRNENGRSPAGTAVPASVDELLPFSVASVIPSASAFASPSVWGGSGASSHGGGMYTPHQHYPQQQQQQSSSFASGSRSGLASPPSPSPLPPPPSSRVTGQQRWAPSSASPGSSPSSVVSYAAAAATTNAAAAAVGKVAVGAERSFAGSTVVTRPVTPLPLAERAPLSEKRTVDASAVSPSLFADENSTSSSGGAAKGTATSAAAAASVTNPLFSFFSPSPSSTAAAPQRQRATTAQAPPARKATPRAKFSARLCRAERMSAPVARAFGVDVGGSGNKPWLGGDNVHGCGQRVYRTCEPALAKRLAALHARYADDDDDDEDEQEQEQGGEGESEADGEHALQLPLDELRAHQIAALQRVSPPLLWCWSR